MVDLQDLALEIDSKTGKRLGTAILYTVIKAAWHMKLWLKGGKASCIIPGKF